MPRTSEDMVPTCSGVKVESLQLSPLVVEGFWLIVKLFSTFVSLLSRALPCCN